VQHLSITPKTKKMKKLIILACLFSWTFNAAKAQDTAAGKPISSEYRKNRPNFFKEKNQAYYEHKFKTKQTGAWVLLIGGAAIGAVGYFVYNSNANKTSSDLDGVINDSFNSAGGLIAMYAGGFMITGSVPLFISAGHYKKKIINTTASLGLQHAPELVRDEIAYVPFPSLSLTFHF
jgi:hypothetical protein